MTSGSPVEKKKGRNVFWQESNKYCFASTYISLQFVFVLNTSSYYMAFKSFLGKEKFVDPRILRH